MRSSRERVRCALAMLMLFIICYAVNVVVAAPYQDLPPRAGHIPVYIREGNQPLSEIYPGLAEAFHEIEKLEHTAKGTTSKTLDSNGGQSSESKYGNAVESSPTNPPETDIASFDAIKNYTDKK